jgi:hypothetical protein
MDMARVEVAGDQLTVQLEGMDKLWTFKSRLEIPLAHVTDAEADPEVVRGWKGWRGPGAQVPGVIVAGTFHHQGDRVFWDVHDPAKAVVIHLADERYARLVIGVDDPAATVAAIRRALGTRGARPPVPGVQGSSQCRGAGQPQDRLDRGSSRNKWNRCLIEARAFGRQRRCCAAKRVAGQRPCLSPRTGELL